MALMIAVAVYADGSEHTATLHALIICQVVPLHHGDVRLRHVVKSCALGWIAERRRLFSLQTRQYAKVAWLCCRLLPT